MVVFRNRSLKRHLETRHIYMRGNFKLFLLTFLFIFQFISLLHEYLFCSSPTPSPITFLIVHLTLRAVPPNLLSDAKGSSCEQMNSSAAERVHGPSLSFIQWRIQRRGPALLFTTQTLTIRRLCCHSSQSWQGRGRGDINWNTFYFSKYINIQDSFYWQMFHNL